jgi:hypothetical protein
MVSRMCHVQRRTVGSLPSVTHAYAAPQADNLYEPLCRGRGAKASQIRPRDKVRAVPKSLSQ